MIPVKSNINLYPYQSIICHHWPFLDIFADLSESIGEDSAGAGICICIRSKGHISICIW
jgi:hypothetical protein